MEKLHNPILEYKPDTLDYIRKCYGFNTREDVENAIHILQDWVKQQKHFVKKEFPTKYLEVLLICVCKGSIEVAKSRLDRDCTTRSLMPQYFQEYNMAMDYCTLDGVIFHGLLPKLMSDHGRVYIMKNIGQKFDSTMVDEYFKSLMQIAEYIRANDYCINYTCIIDYRFVNLTELIKAINLNDVRNGLTTLMNVYGVRVGCMHIISENKLIDIIVSMFKKVMSKKLVNRLMVHKNLDSLYEYVPKEVLPVDYGGEDIPFEETCQKWVKVLSSKEWLEYKREMNKAKTDETQRENIKFTEEYIGMAGSFRTLCVD